MKAGEQFLVVPHTAAMDRLSLSRLLFVMAIRPGLWHELKTCSTEEDAWRRGVLLKRQDPDIEAMVQGTTLYARVNDPEVTS